MNARFAYYWLIDGETPIPFYRVKESDGTTNDISDVKLHQRGHAIPITPTLDTWKTMVATRRRCGFCWKELDGKLETLHDHVAADHHDMPIRSVA